MTKKEKEKKLLDALGLKVGDVINIDIFYAGTRKKYEITEDDDGYYLSTLNGLSSSDCGSMAGYMYTDDANGFYNDEHGHSSIPMIGADGYTMTSSTRIVWFYTIDFMNWF